MKLKEALKLAKESEPDSHKAAVKIDEPWVSERMGTKGPGAKLTHSPGLVSLDYLREHLETARGLKPEDA